LELKLGELKNLKARQSSINYSVGYVVNVVNYGIYKVVGKKPHGFNREDGSLEISTVGHTGINACGARWRPCKTKALEAM